MELEVTNIAKVTCPKCKTEVNEVLYVDESVMEFDGRNSPYQLLKTITTTTKCTRCGSVIEQASGGKKCNIACPSCGISLNTAIGSLETLVEYDEEEGGYCNGKDISGPTITRCLNCGADLTNISFESSSNFPRLKRIK